ncbi:MAG TPA: Zn-dependent alcohol dehydrogenase [Acidimicrobiales bacterium]|nr:Zn-dependent alcohol dehydrogenase [Acidimicrobiales bacterium]
MTEARAVISDGTGTFAVETIEVHDPGAGEVMVDLKASGVCHTDHDMLSAPIPLVMGHEGAGVVSAVGEGVTGVAVGDRVVLNWAIPCGTCTNCVAGIRHLCLNGSPIAGGMKGHADFTRTTRNGTGIYRAFNLGTMSTKTVVRAPAVTKISTDASFEAAAIVGCGVMTGWGSAVNAARVAPGSSAVVLGCGGVGLNVIQGARIAGATSIIAVDPNEARRAMAIEFGATEAIDPGDDDPGLLKTAELIKTKTEGLGAHYAFECTAVASLGAAPLAMIRHGGMAVAVSGIEEEITVDMRLFEFDKTYINPLYGQCQPERDFDRVFALHKSGQMKLDELVTRTYKIDDVAAAFDDLLAGRNAKGVLVF